MPHYQSFLKHLLAVDCVIFGFDEGRLRLLLIRRNFEPEMGNWSLMGGFLRDNESLDEAALRILQELTGLHNVFLEQFHTYGAPERDPGERVVSVAYYALIKIAQHDQAALEAHQAHWIDIEKVPQLIFDHNDMVHRALLTLRHKCQFQPIGFELLPVKFTIPQLQLLYESILGHALDNANFRKKILGMNILKKLSEKETANSKRGAYYYHFDHEKYQMRLSSGFLFEL